MSLLPSIKIGRKSDKNKFHVPCMTHGTSEIGYVSPSYSRTLIPKTNFRLGSRTGIRLSPLFVPTMGDLSLRHYHVFVPYNKVWSPFDAFIDKKPFAFSNGNSSTPLSIPHFCVGDLIQYLMQDNCSYWNTNDTDNLRSNLTCQIYMRSIGSTDEYQLVDSAKWIDLFGLIPTTGYYTNDLFQKWFNVYSSFVRQYNPFSGTLNFGGIPSIVRLANNDPRDMYMIFQTSHGSGSDQNTYNAADIGTVYRSNSAGRDKIMKAIEWAQGLSYPTLDACDFCDSFTVPDVGEFVFCYNFNGAWKRLRSIFLGLGYCFNPFDTEYVTPLKLFALYRAYWSLFGVNRSVNFNDTYCARFSRKLSSSQTNDVWAVDNSVHGTLFYEFIREELTHLTYTCPPDYFSSSVRNVNQSLSNVGNNQHITISSLPFTGGEQQKADASYSDDQYGATASVTDDNSVGALSINLAQRLLRWINRNTVVGSKIYDSLRARYGNITINDESSEGVQRIGEDSVDINISAIYNQTDGINMPLGTYGGVANGGTQKPKYFDFESPTFGCVITLTCVVPQMGYFQGMLRENSDGVNDSFEFYDPTFDAIGWQNVRVNELVADRQFRMPGTLNQTTQLGNFGYQPRYTHLKCGFNRCLGDISLPHMQDSMLPYTLDRFFPQRFNVPSNIDPQTFRSATRGETNRIFQVVSPTDDHVIWQVFFDIDMYAPMRSLSESYDTSLSDDTSSIEVSHE